MSSHVYVYLFFLINHVLCGITRVNLIRMWKQQATQTVFFGNVCARKHLQQLGRDEEVLSAVGTARVDHDAAEYVSLVLRVHPLVDLIHHSERAMLQVLKQQHQHQERHKTSSQDNNHNNTKNIIRQQQRKTTTNSKDNSV